MKTLYFDCGMGAAGDMLSAALLELLPDPAAGVQQLNALGIPGVEFVAEHAEKCGIGGTHMRVLVQGAEEDEHLHEHQHEHEHGHSHQGMAGIRHLVQDHLNAPVAVRQDILAVYELLAAAESKVHGSRVVRLYDVGVSGLHRLLAHLDELMSASVVIAIAGMEGALASVIGGLVDCPVIAVPTSVGYGASFGGLSALLSMLNACAAGISVVNIDNGFGAGFLASRINHMEAKK